MNNATRNQKRARIEKVLNILDKKIQNAEQQYLQSPNNSDEKWKEVERLHNDYNKLLDKQQKLFLEIYRVGYPEIYNNLVQKGKSQNPTIRLQGISVPNVNLNNNSIENSYNKPVSAPPLNNSNSNYNFGTPAPFFPTFSMPSWLSRKTNTKNKTVGGKRKQKQKRRQTRKSK
jgi:hypothetical protein